MLSIGLEHSTHSLNPGHWYYYIRTLGDLGGHLVSPPINSWLLVIRSCWWCVASTSSINRYSLSSWTRTIAALTKKSSGMCSDELQVHWLLKSNIDFHNQWVVGNKVVSRGRGYMCVLHTCVVATVLITVTEYLWKQLHGGKIYFGSWFQRLWFTVYLPLVLRHEYSCGRD